MLKTSVSTMSINKRFLICHGLLPCGTRTAGGKPTVVCWYSAVIRNWKNDKILENKYHTSHIQ
jgi:hypothetical protein